MQIIGVPDKAEKDQIVKSVMDLKNADVEEEYTTEAVATHEDLLMDVRDKLLFEPEYAGDIKEKIPPKSTLRIPWAWLPRAFCLLQEVGEEKLVLDIGRAALLYPDAKPHVHDVLLSMALAEDVDEKLLYDTFSAFGVMVTNPKLHFKSFTSVWWSLDMSTLESRPPLVT